MLLNILVSIILVRNSGLKSGLGITKIPDMKIVNNHQVIKSADKKVTKSLIKRSLIRTVPA